MGRMRPFFMVRTASRQGLELSSAGGRRSRFSSSPHRLFSCWNRGHCISGIWMRAAGLVRPALLGNSFGCQIIADLGVRHRADRARCAAGPHDGSACAGRADAMHSERMPANSGRGRRCPPLSRRRHDDQRTAALSAALALARARRRDALFTVVAQQVRRYR